jgi:hypothetical protein
MKTIRTLVALSALLAFGVSAQTVTGVSVAPANAKPGDEVKATVSFDVTGSPNCGMRINWGDGAQTDSKVNQAKDVPLVLSHKYAAAGNYTVMAEPKRVGSTFGCTGKNQTAVVAVVAPAPVAAAPAAAPAPAAKPAMAAAAPAAAAACPAGWKLTKAGVNKKTKAFTCVAAANTKLPDAKPACPGDLTYFENGKKGQLGCRI